MELYTYGELKPIYFILVDSNGARVAGHTFVATDVYLILDNAAGIDVSANCVHQEKGLYKWTPSTTAHTSGEIISLLITDSAGTTFIDNAKILATGGHISARFNG